METKTLKRCAALLRDGCGNEATAADYLDAAAVEIERLTTYVDAFRREETRADLAERDLEDLRAAARKVDSLTRAESVSPTAFSEAWKQVRGLIVPPNVKVRGAVPAPPARRPSGEAAPRA